MNIRTYIFIFSFLAFVLEVMNPSSRFVRCGLPTDSKIYKIHVNVKSSACFDCFGSSSKGQTHKKPLREKTHAATTDLLHPFVIIEQIEVGYFLFKQIVRDGFHSLLEQPPLA